jgi:hypothetical protein
MYQDIKNLFSKNSELNITKTYKIYLLIIGLIFPMIFGVGIIKDKMELKFKQNNELFLCKKISFVKKQLQQSIELTDGSVDSSKYQYSQNEKFCLKYDYLRYISK